MKHCRKVSDEKTVMMIIFIVSFLLRFCACLKSNFEIAAKSDVFDENARATLVDETVVATVAANDVQGAQV